MTRYTVVWDKEVEDPFMNGRFGPASRSYRHRKLVDRELAVDPEVKGQAQADPLNRVIDATAANSTTRASVSYRIIPDDRQVRVTLVVIRDR